MNTPQGSTDVSDLYANLTEAQKEAVAFPSSSHPHHKKKKHLVIEAGAGAGKTHVLSRRAARLCTPRTPGGVHPSRLFLVTFSRAADRELRERVQRSLAARGLETEARLVHVSTIDSLLLSLVDTRFPLFWEHAIRGLWTNTPEVHRYSPPSITLLDEALVKEQLARRLESVLEELASDQALNRVVCDFLLSGALQGGSGGGGVLGGILSALLSEHLLCLDVPAPLLAARTFHPGLPAVLMRLRALAQECYAERLLKGTLTYTDAAVFLYNLYCAPEDARAGTLFDCSVPGEFPVAPEELIVDEYQDTSRIQHALLYKLATHRGGRMVVVGDPKQSIYGFRNAHVEVMESLKVDPHWHHVELTRNFRSDPKLLEEINTLSSLAFQWAEDTFPETFVGSGFQQAAHARRVCHNPLTAGRSAAAGHSDAAGPPEPLRLEIVSASLSKERGGPDTVPSGALREFLWDVFCNSVRALGLRHATKNANGDVVRFPWSDVAVLCERNEHVRETARRLVAAGVPATALVSGHDKGGDFSRESHLRASLFLLQSLLRPLSNVELFEVFCSRHVNLPWEECVEFFTAYGRTQAAVFFASSPEEFPEGPAGEGGALRWPALKAFHTRWHSARACSPVFAFQAWQTLRMAQGLQGNTTSAFEESLECALSDEFALLFSSWCGARSALADYQDLPAQLAHWRMRMEFDAQAASDPNAIQVMTIHAAKGLEWPYVYFWPQARRERKARDFELVSHRSGPVLKWLPASTTTLGVLKWTENDDALGPSSAPFLKEGAKKPEEVHFADLQKKLEETYERQRVFYTAFTRAREFLGLVHPLPAANRRNSLRDKLGALARDEKGKYREANIKTLEEGVLASYLDLYFDTGHVKLKQGSGHAQKQWSEPWTSRTTSHEVHGKPWIRFTEPAPVHWQTRIPQSSEERVHTMPNVACEDEIHIKSQTQLQTKMQNENQNEISTFHAKHPSGSGSVRWHWPKTSHSLDLALTKPVPQTSSIPHLFSPGKTAQKSSLEVTRSTQNSSASVSPVRTRAELNPYYARRLAASQGVLYHARQEQALDAENPARTLKRVALRTWQELEIWHEPESPPTVLLNVSQEHPSPGPAQILLEAPSRNILDFLCYVESDAFPRSFLSPNALAAFNALPAGTFLACVLDFKTGLPNAEHDAQMTHYASLASRLVKEGFGLPQPPKTFGLITLLCHEMERTSEGLRASATEAGLNDRFEKWSAAFGNDGVFLGRSYFVRSQVLTET